MTNKPPGNMPGPGSINNPSFGTSGTPGANNEATSQAPAQTTEQTYTQSQVDKLIHTAKSAQGRELAEARDKIATLEAEKTNLQSDMSELNTEITTLEEKISNLASNDPARMDMVKELQGLKKDRTSLKQDYRNKLAELNKREAALKPREDKVNSFMSELLCETVAEEYGDKGNSKLLRSICSTTGATDEDTIRGLAKTLWGEPPTNPGNNNTNPQQTNPQQVMQTYSGHTDGGGTVDQATLVKQAKNAKNLPFSERMKLKNQLIPK